jgi:hypothetical protein
MRLVRPISEDEMIAVFLRGEIESARYGDKLRTLLARDGWNAAVLRQPNLGDHDANAYRRGLLDEHRAYDRREGLFHGFPRRADWFRAVVTRDEALDMRYIAWDWWLRISGGSRSPCDAARKIHAGEIPGVTADDEPYTSADVELIAVTTPLHEPLVVVEGHARLTAYALFPTHVPPQLEIVLGVAPDAAAWWAF